MDVSLSDAAAEKLRSVYGYDSFRGEQLQIISQQCPFGEAAQQFPHVVCAVDRGMIRGMLAALYGETNPHFSATRPAGDATCITCV